MISIIMFILIGIKLNMMSGLYLALIIIDIVMWIISVICKIVKIGLNGLKN